MIHTIDLHFQGQPEIIASYVLRGPRGIALIETGPGSTLPALKQGLHDLGFELADITDILITHIHLDHAGAAGQLARETGATVHVHAVGAPHMIDPERLLRSARRIYGELMDPLWGDFLPVPASQVHAVDGDARIDAAGLSVQAIDTPGHATHHLAYVLDGQCFTGDVGAVRLPGYAHVRLPTPPPDINPPVWKHSLDRLIDLKPDRLLLTHFGAVNHDAAQHLRHVAEQLDAYVDWFRPYWQAGATPESIIGAFKEWVAEQARADGCDEDAVVRYEIVVPSYMQATGMFRYFRQSAV
ncbi:MAG: MBL fold metallo-hydrolase [Chloroflexi bacterium]|nr:MBL fold metallo-hydrolase [Chloroflexota bacterium]